MLYGEKLNRQAVFIGANGETDRLNRIPFMSGSFNEAWLQELLEENPSIIPSGDVSSEYAPLICIGREVPVGSGETQGYIDNLYITPTGRIVIVETKLFRNQESRRTVVAQIIDYAKELQKWDAAKLDEVASEYFYRTKGQAFKLIDIMAAEGYLTLSDETRLIDNINNNLSSASFLLMIVGDGIRSGVQQLADFLNENTAMSFNLALAEMEVYQSGSGVIVIPNLLQKTTVIERYVVSQKPYGTTSFSAPSRENGADAKPYIKKPVLSRREFIEAFSANGGYDIDDVVEFVSDLDAISGLSVATTATELTVRFAPDGSHSYPLLTLGISANKADMWVMPGRIKSALEKHGCFPFEADTFLEFYKRFVDTKRCKAAPYENEAGFYYAIVEAVLRHSSDFLEMAEQVAHAISNNK